MLSPGPQLLEWADVVAHPGAPYRIALSVNGDAGFDGWILLDHIPHNNDGVTTFASPKHHVFNVTIPNIDCPLCTLQIINLMTDKLRAKNMTQCSYPPTSGVPPVCFSVYHSCADVTISGTIDPADYVHTNPSNANATYFPDETATWLQRDDGKWCLPSNNVGCPAIANNGGGAGPNGRLIAAVVVPIAVVFVGVVGYLIWKRKKEQDASYRLQTDVHQTLGNDL